MKQLETNYYGSLCTQMYEVLHPRAPQDELDFYLSYAKAHQKILEPLCGSGRFLIPFLERGFEIYGMDASKPMLDALKAKAPSANVTCAPLHLYKTKLKFDYIFITSGSMSLFTKLNECEIILGKIKELLTENGVFVFAVDTIANIEQDESDYSIKAQAYIDDGNVIKFYSKNQYQESSQTQFMHSIYELCKANQKIKSNQDLVIQNQDSDSTLSHHHKLEVLQTEYMDFQTHLYGFGQMEDILYKIGFSKVITYKDFKKNLASSNDDKMFLFECYK